MFAMEKINLSINICLFKLFNPLWTTSLIRTKFNYHFSFNNIYLKSMRHNSFITKKFIIIIVKEYQKEKIELTNHEKLYLDA